MAFECCFTYFELFTNFSFLPSDWVFDIPNKYSGCTGKSVAELDRCDLEALSNKAVKLQYLFNATVHAPNTLIVSCKNKKKQDGLPDYVWYVKGEYEQYMSSSLTNKKNRGPKGKEFLELRTAVWN